ncbi:MAG: arginine--tRNA ligase [Desulfobacteraceae bacterium]|nr:arginine--tRNA ligase [Desulfobacteraceae bacterium]
MKSLIREAVVKAWDKACSMELFSSADIPVFDVSDTKNKDHGDIAANIAMVSAKVLKKAPLKIAEILTELIDEDFIEKIEIAGPGFINFFIRKSSFPPMLGEIFEKGENFGSNEYGLGKKIMVEFVSANPTGPLHIGHGRGAAVGDATASVLKKCGYEVTREYYINDSGRQIKTLGNSVYLRYLELMGKEIDFPQDHYQGDYISDIAKELENKYGRSLLENDENESVSICAKYAADSILKGIEEDLNAFNVIFDNWYSEQSLYDSNKVFSTIEFFENKNLIYEKDGAKWFRTTDYGDEKDRVVVRSNGDTTYFASDISYHMDKFQRGFNELVDVWGADHHGYINRIKACIEASGHDSSDFHVILVQLVTLLRSGKLVQMSTRSGEFDTLKEVVDEVGVDAARFFFLMRSYDSGLDFDLDLAKKKSSENPVYYVQYVHARISSIIEKAEKDFSYTENDIMGADLSLLDKDEEIELIKTLMKYKEAVLNAGKEKQPHRVTFYLMELAGSFHSYYNMHKVLTEDKGLSCSRLYLVKAVKEVVKNGLNLLGVSAPEKM